MKKIKKIGKFSGTLLVLSVAATAYILIKKIQDSMDDTMAEAMTAFDEDW